MESMKINGCYYNIVDVYDLSVTVPDSFVVNDNKTCSGHGEAKLYMGSKEHMRSFYTGNSHNQGFYATCIVLKEDLLQYMETIKHEYYFPSVLYRGQGTSKNISNLWKQRLKEIQSLPDFIEFKIKDQKQIKGNRGYVKSAGNPLKGGFGVIRTVSLPFVSYISVMKLENRTTKDFVFYWKLFTDFSQMAEQQYIAKHYGKKKLAAMAAERKKRGGQVKYRQNLFALFQHCPFSKIDDLRLLVASHIKPWAICDEHEKTDTDNGFILSPLFDRLFDKGYISFEDDGQIKISNWLSHDNKMRIDFSFQVCDLHLTDKRRKYLDYHRRYVFKQ